MVSGRDATFRFRVDDKQFQQKVRNATEELKKLGATTVTVSGNMDKFSGSMAKVGTSSAASAVNFQTATQGALNLSTAMVQTYTSISNLDRANNRAKMSTIAVARAQDLLANKEERLNSLRVAGQQGSQKYLNIQNEIITATADLTVKTEKMAIEQSAVNDIYMLFAANVANVTISSLQTITILLGQEKMAKVASTLATKLHTFATWDGIRAARFASREKAAMTALMGASIPVTHGATLAIRIQTAAVQAYKIALGPIGLILIGISAAMLAYETNAGGLKDSLNSLIGVQEDETASILAERDALDKANKSLDEHQTQIFKLPRTYAEANYQLKELTRQTEHYGRALGNLPTGFKEALAFSGEGGLFPSAHASVMPQDRSNIILSNGFRADDYRSKGLPGYIGTNEALGISGGNFKTSGAALAFSGNRPLGNAGFKIQEEYLIQTKLGLIKEVAKLMASTEAEANDLIDSGDYVYWPFLPKARIDSFNQSARQVVKRLQEGGLTLNEIESVTILAGLKNVTPESYALQQHADAVQKGVKEYNQGITDAQQRRADGFRGGKTTLSFSAKGNLQTHVSPTFKGRALDLKEYQRRLNIGGKINYTFIPGIGMVNEKQAEKVTTSLLISAATRNGVGLSRDTAHDVLVASAFGATHITHFGMGNMSRGFSGGIQGFIGAGMILSNDDPRLKRTSGFGETRLAAFQATGFDIGAVADSIMPAEAIRIAKVEKNIASFGNTTGGFANAAISYLNMTAKTNSFGQKVALNNLLSGKHAFADASAGRVMGRTDFFGTGFFNSTGATGALQVARGSIKIDPIFTTRRNNMDANLNRLRNGGTRIVDEFGEPLFELNEAGAVGGGFTSLAAYRADARKQFRGASDNAISYLQSFGITTLLGGGSKSVANTARSAAIGKAAHIGGLLSRTGLGVVGFRSAGRMGQNFDYGSFRRNQIPGIQAANQYTLARAGQIDILDGGFGLGSFFGSGASLDALQAQVAIQDGLIAALGLNRSTTFNIIDTSGRGREEIDDRIRWHERLNAMSSGTSPL